MAVKKFEPNMYESSWRKRWEEEDVYNVDNPINATKKKYYCLDMFPYPSGEGLHVGHWRGYVLSDVWARYKMAQGYNVLHPMGWDNFGLPAENDAIRKEIHPKISTAHNINNMKRQLKEIGCVYDWSKELNTTDPGYYKWTQFLFLKMFEQGLAYQELQTVNWCNHCKVVLANEEVEGGKCERCGGTDIERREINQWMLKITQYADRLSTDLDKLDWPEKVKDMQRNWIGKSVGANVKFKVKCPDQSIEDLVVYTTRPETLFGVSFIVIAPEHKIIEKIVLGSKQNEVNDYIRKTHLLSNVERQMNKDKSGVFTGNYAVNPINGRTIPIWIANYVLKDYGTGAIMAVPAHDERDFCYAAKYNLPIIEVIEAKNVERDDAGILKEAYTGEGKIVNSDYLNGLDIVSARKIVIKKLEEMGCGESKVNFKMRDWIFARQRYWGEPIPIIHCEHCGVVPVPYDQLPVELPDVESYQPTDDGSSPLARIEEFVNTTCPKCGKLAKRETDTMPQWAGSCWYFLRYPDVKNCESFASKDKLRKWLPVDMYVGGIEHAVLHLLYARFWTKVFYDLKLVEFDEPFVRLFNQGMITRDSHRCKKCNRYVYDNEIDLTIPKEERVCQTCGEKLEINCIKMSKSKGNVVSPDELVNQYGTDALRISELFVGDPSLDAEWSDKGIKGAYKLLNRYWKFLLEESEKKVETSSDRAKIAVNELIKDVTCRIESFKFNTAIAAFMQFINEAEKMSGEYSQKELDNIVKLFGPIAPHFAEEIWINHFGNKEHVFNMKYPIYEDGVGDNRLLKFPVSINGKTKFFVYVEQGATQSQVEDIVKSDDSYIKYLQGNEVVKIIFVPNRQINYVLK